MSYRPADTRAATEMPNDPVGRRQLLVDLRAVVVALDKRQVHPERAGERAIAADASALRSEALRRIAALDRDDPPL